MLKVITPVAHEPITLAEARHYLRIPDGAEEDAVLISLIASARAYCEHFTRRALAEQTLELVLDRFPDRDRIDLPCPPLKSVSWIRFKDRAGVETELSATEFIADPDAGQVVRIRAAWPVFTPYPVSPIRIRYVAGYETLPPTIGQALLMLVGHWYENREATGSATGEIAFSVHALLAPERVEVF